MNMEDISVCIVKWCACTLFATSMVSDLWWRRIPNAVVVLLFGFFAAFAFAGGIRPFGALWAHLATCATMLAVGFALYLTGRFGAGDGKLLGAAGVWVGPADMSLFLFGLATAALALSMFAAMPFEQTRRLRAELPFALAIAPPAMIVIISRPFLHQT